MLLKRYLNDHLLDILFPPRCFVCSSRLPANVKDERLCYFCSGRVEKVGLFCPWCGYRSRENSNCCCGKMKAHPLLGLFWYRGLWKKSILRLKYYRQPQLSGELGKMLGRFLLSLPVYQEAPAHLVTFVPLHHWKEKSRGYNQSFLLAREAAAVLNLPLLETMIRKWPTEAQATLNRRERRENIHKAFSLKKGSPVEGKTLLVIDDVVTTGATMEEVSHLLLQAGAARFLGAAVAVQGWSN